VSVEQGVKEEKEEESTAAVGDLTVAFEENLFLSQEEEEYDRPVTPPAQMPSSDDAPPSSKLESFVIEERREVLSVVSWNTHSFRFMNRPEQRMGMARVLSRYDLVLLQEIPCGEKARESLEYFCSVINQGGDNPFDFLLSETLAVSSSSLNAILFRQDAWHVVHSFSTTTLAKNGGTATPARIRAQKETMQARIDSDVTEIHALAQGWGCLSSSDFVVLVAGDFNELPPATVSADL